ncbi:MAG: hypothetical protein IPP12_00295 [Nitrospira sp.]|nr:hypothetical protein [Nitrospira sp.]
MIPASYTFSAGNEWPVALTIDHERQPQGYLHLLGAAGGNGGGGGNAAGNGASNGGSSSNGNSSGGNAGGIVTAMPGVMGVKRRWR